MRRERVRVFVNQSNLVIRSMSDLDDVDLTLLEDGSILVYDSTSESFVSSKQTNDLTISNINIDGSTITNVANDENLTFVLTGNSSISVSNSRIIELADPVVGSDAATKDYVDVKVDERFTQLSANTLLSFSADAGSDNILIASETLNVAGGQGVSTSAANNSITIDLEDTGITPGEYGSLSTVPVINVNSKGQITSVFEVPVTAFITLNADIGEDFVTVLFESLVFEGGTGVTTEITPEKTIKISIGQDVATTANVTFNDVTVDGTLYSNDITASTVEIFGNLTVHGTTTSINTEEILLQDNIIILNSNLSEITAPSQDAGISINRGSEEDVSFLWDETNDRWTLGNYALVAQEFVGNMDGGSF